MRMTDEDRKIMEGILRSATADLRPSMELAVETITEAMGRVPGGGAVPQLEGPEIWTWIDRRGKVYAVAPSPDSDGHPMLTIRQPVTKELGVWITSTVLLLGNDRASLLNSATVALVSHSGAYAGYESVVKAIAESGNAFDGITRACEIAGRDPAVNSAIATALRGDSKDEGGLN